MKELVEYIARSIASEPDEVVVTRSTTKRTIESSLRLEVAPDDKGKMIGRQGRVAQSIRVLLRISAVKQGTRVTLEIV